MIPFEKIYCICYNCEGTGFYVDKFMLPRRKNYPYKSKGITQSPSGRDMYPNKECRFCDGYGIIFS